VCEGNYFRKGCRTEVVVKSRSLSLENTQKASWNSVRVRVYNMNHLNSHYTS